MNTQKIFKLTTKATMSQLYWRIQAALDWHRPTTSDTVAGGEYKLPYSTRGINPYHQPWRLNIRRPISYGRTSQNTK